MTAPGAAAGLLLLLFSSLLGAGHARVVISSGLQSRRGEPAVLVEACQDCRKILQMFGGTMSKDDTQVLVRKALYGLCLRSSAAERDSSKCHQFADTHLPSLLSSVTHQTDICTLLGLCTVQSERRRMEILTNSITVVDTTPSLVREVNPEIGPQCALCLFLLKKLESMLPKERTEEAVVQLMGQVCSLMPKKYEDQCQDFLQKYGKQVIDFLLSSAAPHTICMLLHLCLMEEVPPAAPAQLSECEACQTLSALARLHLGHNATEAQTSSLLANVCQRHPNAVPQCPAYTQRYGPRLQRILGKRRDGADACKKEDFCVDWKF